MSYGHIKVSILKEATESIAQSAAEDLQRNALTDEEKSKYPMINGVFVTQGLYDLIAKIRSTYKFYEVGFLRRMTRNRDMGFYSSIYAEAALYVPHERYARGKVGYGKHRVNQDGDDVFMVASRLLHNNKYAPGRAQMNMAMSENMDKVLKTAYKVLQPYTTKEIAEIERYDFASSVGAVRHKIYRDTRDAVDKLFTKDDLLPELRALVESGYKFSSPKFHANVVGAFAAMDEYEREANKPCDAYFVLFYKNHNSDDKVDIQEAYDLLSSRSDTRMGEKVTLNLGEIPIDIAGRVAVLNMNEPNHYVEGVGMKVSDDAFWVERAGL